MACGAVVTGCRRFGEPRVVESAAYPFECSAAGGEGRGRWEVEIDLHRERPDPPVGPACGCVVAAVIGDPQHRVACACLPVDGLEPFGVLPPMRAPPPLRVGERPPARRLAAFRRRVQL